MVYSILINSLLRDSDIRFNKSASPIWDRYTTDGTVSQVLHGSSEIAIEGNAISGGYYGIGFSGVSKSVVRGNLVSENMRNISMRNNASGNLVEGNYLRNSRSSSIHIAYDSDRNVVRGNAIVAAYAGGQALLQAYQSSDHNSFTDNQVTVAGSTVPNWVLYVGTDSSHTKFSNNIVSSAAKRFFTGVESIWDGRSASSNLAVGAKNSASYMSQGTVLSPADGSPTSYNGGRGRLESVTFTGNILNPGRGTVPLFHIGAEVSGCHHGRERLVGDVTAIKLASNHVVGSAYQSLVSTHVGSLTEVGTAKIDGDLGVGTEHSTVSAQRGTAGPSVFILDSDGDTVVDGGGDDTIYASVNVPAIDGIGRIRLPGSASLSAMGNAQANTLDGNAGSNFLAGGPGDDSLQGGEGSDTLTGGEGADSFVLAAALDGSVDTVTDFGRGSTPSFCLR